MSDVGLNVVVRDLRSVSHNFFFFVTDGEAKEAGVFIPHNNFQDGLRTAGKA